MIGQYQQKKYQLSKVASFKKLYKHIIDQSQEIELIE